MSYFFFDLPLYTPLEITEENKNSFISIITLGGNRFTNLSFDGYNPIRNQDSTFTGYAPIVDVDNFYNYGGVGQMQIKCKRSEDVFTFLLRFDVEKKQVIKVGQYPSIADFHIHPVKKYKKVLGQERLKEFTKAIGLSANGIGIGSFVYLRRIFEFLVFDTFEKNKEVLDLTKAQFSKFRMDEKIENLNLFMPDFLVKNKKIYSILSLGIHELDEHECLESFESIKIGIEIILDKKLEEIEKIEKELAASKTIEELHNKYKK